MNNTVTALQGLYVKLGGKLTDTYDTIAGGVPVGDYATIPDMIEACTQKAGSGGGSGSALPAVTAADNGSVLAVVEGAWDKGTVNSGVYIVNKTIPQGETVSVLDKTFAEIQAAYANSVVLIKSTNGSNSLTEIVLKLYADTGDYEVIGLTDEGGTNTYTTDTTSGYPQSLG